MTMRKLLRQLMSLMLVSLLRLLVLFMIMCRDVGFHVKLQTGAAAGALSTVSYIARFALVPP